MSPVRKLGGMSSPGRAVPPETGPGGSPAGAAAQRLRIGTPRADWVVVGLDNGGTTDNATVLDAHGRFLVPGMLERPSLVREGPEAALGALRDALSGVLRSTGVDRSRVRAVGLCSPGPASANGVISRRGSTNFAHPDWHGFDLRAAAEAALGVPVVYANDGNAAGLYAHRHFFGAQAAERSSVAVVIGTGLGGAVVHRGQVVTGATGTAGELGHVAIPMAGLLEPDQPEPRCNCGKSGDAESVASLTAIEVNLLPYWLTRYPGHELAGERSPAEAARRVRALGETGDPLATAIFRQQAMAVGRLLTIVADVLDPDAYFVGGGVVEAAPAFREWFLATVREHTDLREEAAETAAFSLVPDLDMAGARGAAVAALSAVPAAASIDVGAGGG